MYYTVKTIMRARNGTGFVISPYTWNDPQYAYANRDTIPRVHNVFPNSWMSIGEPGWWICAKNEAIFNQLEAHIPDLRDMRDGEYDTCDITIQF